ncbi:uncharacterized protein LOC111282775 isoform X2 [Durio zibethinus]|uniref:Uncharacterized protein LOC111282775 isoform X2 n=1 Tax=Durio zibethinus TaxID=66656 RepID=A0A6P5XEH8_DURZI|nr:uncharacterized protein LOC111282775 isoform X2 [Durio zibethinus]
MVYLDLISTRKEPLKALLKCNKQVLISLLDKKNLAFLVTGLQEFAYTIVSSGGTASALENAGVSVTKVEQLTCFPEMISRPLL